MIGLYAFNELNINEKANLVWSDSIYIDNYGSAFSWINLYYLYDFYVEVYYSSEINKITKIISFKKGHNLDKYLEKIKIDS